jgi:hypothetical protein
MIIREMLRAQEDCAKKKVPYIPTPLDKAFEIINGNVETEARRLVGLVTPPNGGATANGSGPAHGNGAPNGANPGTQRANGSPQRSPSTVTSVLAAARSGDTGSASDADDWEAIKRAERAKRRAAQ